MNNNNSRNVNDAAAPVPAAHHSTHTIATAAWVRQRAADYSDGNSPGCPGWLAKKLAAWRRRAAMRRIAREAVVLSDKLAAEGLGRDYRGWHRDPSRRIGPGSGRSADWHDVSFTRLCTIARTVYRDLGYRNGACRNIAGTLHRLQGGWDNRRAEDALLAALPPCTIEPHYLHHSRPEDFDREMASGEGLEAGYITPLAAQRWYLFLRWHVAHAIAESERAQRLARIACDPDYRISGYLADSVLSWMRGESGYEGCSGCESYMAHHDHPEDWPLLLSHAPTGASGPGWEQVYPHERERAARLHAEGWFETFRLNDSIYTRRNPLNGPSHGQ